MPEPSPDKPTTLVINGKRIWILSIASWGFCLVPDEDAIISNITGQNGLTYNRRDLMSIIVDSPGFCTLSALEKIEKVQAAIAARASKTVYAHAAGAINWWKDYVREKDSHSP